MKRMLVPIGLAAAVLALLPTGTTLAQSAEKSANALEEVVVTATRREERLQDVPISVSAYSQEKLDSQGLRNIDDLTRLTPGVNFSRNGMGSSANYNDENSDISIRGIDSTAGAATTAIYIDDSPVQSRHIGFGAVNVYPALFDVDRVEVLRGPQGTLFGAGAEGGAVRFITPAPGLQQYTGYVRAEASSTSYGDPSYEFGAAAGGPLIEDKLGFRISASYRRDGGWVDRVNFTRAANDFLTPPTYAGTTEKAANWQQTATFRVALKWKASDSVAVTPSLYYQRLQINDTAAYWMALSDPAGGVYRDANALTNPSTDPYYLGAVKVEWDAGFAQLVSNTSYLSRDQHSVSDYTQYLRATWALPYYPVGDGFGSWLPSTFPPPGAGGYAPFGDTQRNFYQEIRLASSDAKARLTWNAGVFYSRTNENIPEDILDPTLNAEMLAYTGGLGGLCNPAPTSTVDCPAGMIFHGPEDRIIEKQLAAFGEITFKIVETVKATVGVRLSKVDITGTTASGGAFGGTPIFPQALTNASSTEKPVTPKFALSYQPDRDDLFYFSAAKGYRSGGVNPPLSVTCDANLELIGYPVGSDGRPHAPGSFSSDSLWSYEIGAKNTLLGRRLQINTSLFTIDWKKIQQSYYLINCGEQFSANLGQAKSHGGDIDISFKPTTALTLGLTAAYTDAKYARATCAGQLVFTAGACVNASDNTVPASAPLVSEGDRLQGAPWTFNFSAEYAVPFAAFAGRTGYVRVDYQRTTAQTALLSSQNYHNASYDTTLPGLPATRNLQLRAGMRFSGFDVSVFANNLTNDHPLLFASRDIASDCYAGGTPCGGAGQGPSYDNLYFGRGVRPRTIGVTGTYRY